MIHLSLQNVKKEMDMKKMFKLLGRIILAVLILIALLILVLFIKGRKEANRPIVEPDYQSVAKTGGEIEAEYLKNGNYEIVSAEYDAEDPMKTFTVYYPKEMETSSYKYPVIVYCNGTGARASKTTALFEHWASWGFIVIGNEDQSTGTGETADKTLEFLLKANEDRDSIFYGKLDTDNIGIAGHSQGGVAVLNAVTSQAHNSMYKAAVPLSPTNEETAEGLGWS